MKKLTKINTEINESGKQKWEKEQINSKVGSFIKDIILSWVWLWKEQREILLLKK